MNLFWKVMISIFFLVMFLSDIIKLSDDPKNYRLHLADVVIDVGLMFGFLHLVGVC
jgi:hypothetical protein